MLKSSSMNPRHCSEMHLITKVQPKPNRLSIVNRLEFSTYDTDGIIPFERMIGISCWNLTAVSVPTNCNENSEKRVLQKSHSDSAITEMTSYFHGLNNLEWKSMDHQFPENKNSFYTRVPGMIKMGLVKLEQDGHFQLHWHKGI